MTRERTDGYHYFPYRGGGAHRNHHSEHPRNQGEKCHKVLGENIGCKDQNSSWDLIILIVASGQQYVIGEKPTVMLFTYIIAMQVHQNKCKSPR